MPRQWRVASGEWRVASGESCSASGDAASLWRQRPRNGAVAEQKTAAPLLIPHPSSLIPHPSSLIPHPLIPQNSTRARMVPGTSRKASSSASAAAAPSSSTSVTT